MNTILTTLVRWPGTADEQRAFLSGMEFAAAIAAKRSAMCFEGAANRDQAIGIELGAAQVALAVRADAAKLAGHVGRFEIQVARPMVPSERDVADGRAVRVEHTFTPESSPSLRTGQVLIVDDAGHKYEVPIDLILRNAVLAGDPS